jgi:cobaltochelatase CobN
LGTDGNEVALQNASLNTTISSELTNSKHNITIFTKNETIPQNLDFSDYSVIFIESQNETMMAEWNARITTAKASGSMVIGYNLSTANATVPNVDLGSTNYTDIERYWIQGGDTNMESMLKFMGQKFCDAWVGEDIPDPVLLQPKTKLLFIMNFGTYYVSKVYSEKTVIQDLFEITVYTGEEGEASTESFTDCDVIYIRHLGASTMYAIEDRLREAKAAGAYIPTFMEMVDVWGISNVNISEPAYAPISGYAYEGGETNTENWIRWSGAIFNDVYIQYKPPQEVPRGPSKGIYRPETYPKVFDNSTEYLEWYADHGYNASNLTVGIIGWEYAAITALESRGVNVIAAHTGAIQDGAKYLSFKGFYLYYGNPPAGKDRLATLNVPVIKVVTDYYSSPDEWEDSIEGLNLKSIPFQVVQPEIDGTIEYI